MGAVWRMRENISPHCRLPSFSAECCALWCHAVGELDSASCFVELFEFVVLTSIMSAHIALN